MRYELGIDVSLVDVQLRTNLTAAFQRDSETAAVRMTPAERHIKEGAKQQNAGQILVFSVIWEVAPLSTAYSKIDFLLCTLLYFSRRQSGSSYPP